ncbi:MAG: pilus assembly protein N-terminal domain-containing protein [Caulobacteraceae bacterium]|nr:pilus assembly protein N-terminal domain-containing protein [Caulobacteraceae bacterium]
MRRLLLACLVAAAVSTPAMAAPQTSVAIDHTTRINLRSAAASVVVGNPAVADVTVVDPHTLFLQGKGYGVTEVVVLDPLGRTIWQGEVVVTAPTQGAVSIYRGSQVTEMACAQSCAASVRSPGQDGRAAAPATTTP